MKSFGSQISSVLSKNKEPGLDEICTLLNLEDNPIALVESANASLVFINSRLMKMTGRTNQDAKGQDFHIIFQDLDLSTISSGEIRSTTILKKDKSSLPVRVRFDFIDPRAHWVVIKAISEVELETEKGPLVTPDFQLLTRFARLAENDDLDRVLQAGLAICSEFLKVESLCLYQVDPSAPQLKKVVSQGEQVDFPQVLPSSDLVRFDQPGLWVTGNRVLSELQRFARLNRVDYLGTAPLVQGEGFFGLFVTGGRGETPKELHPDSLELLAAMIFSLFQQGILTENLETKVQESAESITLRNIVFENMNEGILVLDKQLKILEMNQAAEWMLGYANWEVKGQSYENILIGTERLFPALQEALTGKLTHDIGKASLNRRNGQSFPVLVKVVPVNTGDQVSQIEVFLADISEHEQSKALTQQLEHRAVLGDYTAAFAHDVRNPINNISTGLQLLQAKLSEDDPNQEVINRMQGDCTRLNHLMESFLAFSRPLELKFESIDVELFLKRILDRWQPRMARVNVKSLLHVEAGTSHILGDPRSLENVITNLISNALEAMVDIGDTLAVKVSETGKVNGHSFVEISISDNGPGIPVDILEHIFEPFVTTRQKGTGLGLAITKQIVTAHKGSIRVNSFPGGTVFTVQLPAESGE